ncbi:MAG TPA: amino acid ABC transporter substrate-binding protein [Mesorhizobium sp.]|jgi:branched-chain amino acid transport system substrate-binding protein|uniref:amino acid ABC transporter substrate-binding protein n=1 Tax=Mesorhizobium sp. TaxID=1871066 RepID=UPI002DDCD96A|nr:amino acid ABC transporter substrate-binding protein [Mesorhizobium sp.]HEV2505362.1 amino acid ABC transporter substrate-binding protein [Mesorhizobium sp.]
MTFTISRRTFLAAAALAPVTTRLALAADAPLRIGYSMCLTGLFAQAAPSQVNAYELWKDQVNAAGGLDIGGGQRRPVEFVSYDDQSNPANAVRIYEKLITQDKVDLLAAPWSTPIHLALAPVLARHKFPMVGNTAASVKLREVKPGYIWFPTAVIPDKVGEELAAFMAKENVKTAAVFANVLPLAQEIKTYLLPALEKNGIKLVANEDFPPDIKDMTTLISGANQSSPDAFIVLSYPSDTFLFATQARQLNVKAPFVLSLIGPTISAYQQAFGTGANNIVTVGHWSPNQSKWPKAKPFYDAYLARYKEAPDALDSVLSFMSMEILEQAVATAGLDREKLRETIASTTFDTINGPVKFDGVQNSMTPTSFLQIQDSSLELVWPEQIKTKDFRPKTGW